MQNHPETGATSGRSLKPGLALVLGSLAFELAASKVIQQFLGPSNFLHGLTHRAMLYALPIYSIALVMGVSGLFFIHRAQARMVWSIPALIFGYLLALTYFLQTAGLLGILLRSPVLPRN